MSSSNNDPNVIREKLDALLGWLGIAIDGTDYLHRILDIIDIQPIPGTSESEILLHKGSEISQLFHILNNIDGQDRKILKKKFKKILSGKDWYLEKSDTSNEAQDTLFELKVLADFRAAGFEAKLCDPNPDILVEVNDRQYGVEIKRLSSTNPKRAAKKILESAKQLDDSFFTPGQSQQRGIMFIGIEKHLNPDSTTSEHLSAQSAKISTDKELNDFFVRHHRLLSIGPSMRNEKNIVLLVNYSINTWNSLTQNGNRVTNMMFGFASINPEVQANYAKQFKTDIAKQLLEYTKVLNKVKPDIGTAFVDAGLLLPCSAATRFDSKKEAEEYVAKELGNGKRSQAKKCYQCDKWHIYGPETLQLTSDQLSELKKMKLN